MKKSLFKWFVAVGAVLALLMAGSAWADGHGKGHRGGGYHAAPPHHAGHVYRPAPRIVYPGPYYARPPVYHHVNYYYAPPPPPVQYHTYYVPAPAPVYVAPPPPGFAFSATISEPGFSLGIAAGN